jgi:hypothetical protein
MLRSSVTKSQQWFLTISGKRLRGPSRLSYNALWNRVGEVTVHDIEVESGRCSRMAIEELLALIPPPPRLSEAAETTSWPEIEQLVGTKLPSDDRAFGLRYGIGRFEDGTYNGWVINPLAAGYPGRLVEELNLWHVRHDAAPWEFPAAIFPSNPGLLPWGRDEDGGMMGWLFEGSDPDRWSVVTKGHGDESFDRFDLPLTSFLARSLSHQLRPRVWRPEYTNDLLKVVFLPDRYHPLA